jgi:hypothetical protein
MKKLNEIIQGIQSSIQVVLDAALALAFQPIYLLISIIQSIIEVWKNLTDDTTGEYEEGVQAFREGEKTPTVTVYPSTNEGKYAEECEYPIGRQQIGFHINRKEQAELEKIREELNK